MRSEAVYFTIFKSYAAAVSPCYSGTPSALEGNVPECYIAAVFYPYKIIGRFTVIMLFISRWHRDRQHRIAGRIFRRIKIQHSRIAVYIVFSWSIKLLRDIFKPVVRLCIIIYQSALSQVYAIFFTVKSAYRIIVKFIIRPQRARKPRLILPAPQGRTVVIHAKLQPFAIPAIVLVPYSSGSEGFISPV